jgi:hypothetical protein|tara:strand:- start:794 stop:1675 length:882 start_codon:yes stop_codon:yes gene_type:complete
MTDVEEGKVQQSALYKGAAQLEAESDGDVIDTRMKFAAKSNQPEDTEEQKLDKEIEDAQSNGTLGEQEKSWAKRYGDLRRHEAKALADKDASHIRDMEALRQEVQTTSLGTSEFTDDEMAAFADQNPDAMKTMRSVNRRENAKRDAEVQELKDKLSKAEETAGKEHAKGILFEKHPNWEQVTSSDEFHNWADSQPKAVQDWVFENPDDGELLSKAIDFYLAETGTKKTKKRSVSQNAATLVKTGGSPSQVQEQAGARTYKLSWINGLKDSEYTNELQADIKKALTEGRVEDDL